MARRRAAEGVGGCVAVVASSGTPRRRVCVACGPRAADRFPHLLRCKKLWQPACAVVGVGTPRTLVDALCLILGKAPERCLGRRRAPNPPVLSLTLATD